MNNKEKLQQKSSLFSQRDSITKKISEIQKRLYS